MTDIESTDGDYNSNVTGNLTIMKSTKSITFSANVEVTDNGVSFISENFIVDRADWNLTYNVEGTEGVPTDYIISNDLGFTIGVMVQK
jgi:polyisoprenoid-binding protein YceI